MENIPIINRIMIIGSPGSGKSTLSNEIARISNIPLIHLDKIQWIDNENYISQEFFDEKLQDAIQKERWIIDGNYARTLELRMKRADMVIWLDFPRSICLYRVFKRYVKNKGKKNLHGNPDRLDFSFLCFVWKYKKENNPHIKLLWDRYQSQLRFIHIRSGRKLKNFIKRFETQGYK